MRIGRRAVRRRGERGVAFSRRRGRGELRPCQSINMISAGLSCRPGRYANRITRQHESAATPDRFLNRQSDNDFGLDSERM
ncbi:hypothetical protein EVAR_53987_1 [Eumeta japonica]|uniref:Uncharacterized protein n=1 Tax=Eumeta variegata TaxID=151549 RepID=A0A4C1YTI1_EUMVA|nr:hypothetical protein EVAR_53987_1 [Eumeta japonica]